MKLGETVIPLPSKKLQSLSFEIFQSILLLGAPTVSFQVGKNPGFTCSLKQW